MHQKFYEVVYTYCNLLRKRLFTGIHTYRSSQRSGCTFINFWLPLTLSGKKCLEGLVFMPTQIMKSEASTSSTPGQIRSPKPNTICFGSNSGLLPKNRPGLNDPGFLYVFGSMGCNGV